MSFSPEWLALREPADHRARSQDLLDRVGRFLAARPAPLVVDLGCGSGSNFRALASRLPSDARLRLVDNDPALLRLAERSARERCEAVEAVEADLAADLEAVARDADLITGAALLDLCSARWLERLAALGEERAALYFALNYDGRESRLPEAENDHAVWSAFQRHQSRDKGFGPALGPGATAHLAAALHARGRTVTVMPSPWRLAAPGDAELIAALDAGIAEAAAEEGADVTAWRATPRRAAVVGHLDLWSPPPDAV